MGKRNNNYSINHLDLTGGLPYITPCTYYMIKKILFLTFFILTAYISNSQTVVILKKTKNAIYVGADSKVNVYLIDVLTHQTIRDTTTMCKIWRGGDHNFGMIGLFIDQSKQYAIEASEKYKAFDSVIKYYIHTFGVHIQSEMENMRSTELDSYKQMVKDDSPFVSQIIFFGRDSDSLFAAQVYFVLGTPIDKPVLLRYGITKKNLLYGGHIDEIRDTMEKSNIFKKKRNIKGNIVKLIEIESKIYPEWVGGNIDILEVTKKKTKWLQKKQICD